MTLRHSFSLLAFAALAVGTSAQTTPFESGHTDIETEYSAVGGLELLWHDDTADTERDPGVEYLYQPAAPALTTRAAAGFAGSAYDFIGVGANAPLYFFPAESTTDVTLLGASAEEVPAAAFQIGKPGQNGYFPEETRTNSFLNGNNTRYLRYSLVGFSGPGQFSLFNLSANGQVNDWISTANGLSALDAVYAKPGTGHTDYNVAFTATGVYDLTFRAQGYLANGTLISSEDTVFRFGVGAQPVPEPATMAALGVGALGLLRRRRRA